MREYRITFVPYDVDFYAIFKNGVNEFLISREQIRLMLDSVEEFVKNM